MIKVGVIGVGSMGKNYIRNYLELNNLYDLIGFYDIDKKCAKEVSKKYNVKSFDSLDKLLNSVDAVSVVVPSSLHKKIGIQVAEKKVHALMEKPITLNVEDSKELIAAFKKNNLVLNVAHIERFNPVVVELLNRLKNEKVISIEARRYGPYDPRISDTNVIMDLMIHDLDLVLHKINTSGLKRIEAMGVHAKSNNKIDYCTAIIQHQDGVISTVVASRITQTKIRTINVHTENSYYIADLLNRNLEVYQKAVLKESGDKLIQQLHYEKESINNIEPLKAELIKFYEDINNGKSSVTGEDAMDAVKIANLIEKKACDFISVNQGA
jgi:predicted dehydrogenase